MRRAAAQPVSSPPERRADLLLWTAVLLGPLAAGINTIAGFTVAHWVAQVNSKTGSYLISILDVLLCVAGFVLALGFYRRLSNHPEDMPREGRRYFMAGLGLLLSALCLVAVLFQTIAVFTLNPSD